TPCKDLVTTLLERWRLETNTFDLVQGEATITLEDVEILTGLLTQGLPVLVAPDERSTSAICEQWLGVQPPPRAIQGTTVRVSWVKGLFDRLPDEAPEEVVTYHARAFTWVLLGGVLLADRSGDHIPVHILPLVGDPQVACTYSWGSAVLAWLYKVMGRAAFFTSGSLRGTGDIGGFTLLVELWALERFPRIAERYIDGGDLPVDDSIPRGMRWLPIIERHQHRVAMRLEDIRYALDRCTDFVVSLLIFISLVVRQFIFLLFLIISVFLPYFPVDVVCRPGSRVCVTWRSRLAGHYAHVVHRLHRMAPPRSLYPAVWFRAASPPGRRASRTCGGVTGGRFQIVSFRLAD
ncbi:Serine/threonine-protein phosphatase 7 long form homolog, partial [Linum perenne]